MKFKLLFPNVARQRALLIGTIGWLGGALFLAVKLDAPLGFGLLIAYPVIAFGWSFFPKLADRVFWCPSWAVVATDGVAWQPAAAEPPARYEFADISAYRFAPKNKGETLLRLRLHSGAGVELVFQSTSESAAFQKTVEQAIAAYNKANPGADLVAESNVVERFLTSRAATHVLLGILAIDALAVVWGVKTGAAGAQYAPLVLSFPYFIVWLSYVGKRD